MKDSGAYHVWVIPERGPAIHQYVSGLPATFVLGYDDNDPTVVKVRAPLGFKGVTFFPSYYTQREVEMDSPMVRIAAGMALYRVRRLEGETCEAYAGFGDREADREPHVFSGETLGQYGPDLEIGPFQLLCDALGGRLEGERPEPEVAWPRGRWEEPGGDDSLARARDTDETGARYPTEVDFAIHAEPSWKAWGVRVSASTTGGELLDAYATVSLLERREGWMKVQLLMSRRVAARQELMLEGWVPDGVFVPGVAQGSPSDTSRPHFGHRTGKTPTYCTGALAEETPVFAPNGVSWGTVSERVEGVFSPGEHRHRLLNLLGRYRDAFCTPGWHALDTSGIAACIASAEVRASDVVLQCPEPADAGASKH